MSLTPQQHLAALHDAQRNLKDGVSAESTLRKWFSPYQQQVYQEQLEAKPGPAKEPVMVALLAEVLRLHEGQPAQLGGMEERPELNECEVTLGKREENGLYTAHVSLKGQPEEILRVPSHRLLPLSPEQLSKIQKSKERKKGKKGKAAILASGSGGASNEQLRQTETSRDLMKRRRALLDKGEQLTVAGDDVLAHHRHLEALTQRLKDTHARLQRAWQVTQGLLKNGRDTHRQRIFLEKQQALSDEAAVYNADLQWLKAEQDWLVGQPAYKALLANVQDGFTQTKSGIMLSKAELEEDERLFEPLKFEDMLQAMKNGEI